MRPDAFKLCEKYLRRQTLQPSQIIVVDDGEVETEVTLGGALILRPVRKWKLGSNTQARNLTLGLEAATESIIAIIEDDDWYSPNYLETMVGKMTGAYNYALVGEAQSFYYNVNDMKYTRMRNFSFSPTCSTVFTRALLPAFREVVTYGDSKIDYNFWRRAKRDFEDSVYLFPISRLVIGIKGVPGRPGLGVGHDTSGERWNKDLKALFKLKQLIADDVEDYRRLSNQPPSA